MQKMSHTDGPSTAPPRITSYKKMVDPKFLYIPPHKRVRKLPVVGTHHRWPARHQPHAQTSPPELPRPPQRTQIRAAPTRADLEVEVIHIHCNSDEDGVDDDDEREDAVGQLRLRPIGELLADVDPGGAGKEGGEVVAEDEAGGGGDEEEGAVIHEHLPALIHGPRPRRRPPREQWLLAQDQQPQQPLQPVVPQADQEPERDERRPTGSGRLTKPPNYYGVEKGRTENADTPQLDISMSSMTREETLHSPGSGTSSSPTPPGTSETTPISTPATSPDTSVIIPPRDSSWVLPPMPCSLTKEERAGDPVHRHRHWSFTAPGCYPSHPRFLNWFGKQTDWDPGPRRGSTGEQ